MFPAYEWLGSGAEKTQSILVEPNSYFGALVNAFGLRAKSNPYSFMAGFLTNTVAPNAAIVVTIVAVAEFLVGISLLLGLLTRVSSLGGIAMNGILFLAAGHTSSSTAGVNLVMLGAQLAMIVAPSGRVFGVDAILHRKSASIPLW